MTGDNMGFLIQSKAIHTNRILNPFLTIKGIVAGDGVQYPAVVRQIDLLGRRKHALQVVVPNQAVVTWYCYHSVAVDRTYMSAGNAYISRFNFKPACLLGPPYRLRD